jgi:hypothetical protein
VALRDAIEAVDNRTEKLTWKHFETEDRKQIRLVEKLLDKHHARGRILQAEYEEVMLKRTALDDESTI